MRRIASAVLAATLFASGAAVAQTPAVPQTEAPRQHALLVVEMGPDGASVAYARVVDLPLPKEHDGTWTLELLDAAGEPIYSASLRDPSWRRIEFQGAGAAAHQRLSSVAFALRLPVAQGAARVRVLAPAGELPAGDLRAAGLPAGAVVEVGSVDWPEVLP